MKIEIIYFEGCPNSDPTIDLVKQVVSDLGINASVATVEVNSPDEAKQHHFFGSPTVQINGVDADPSVRSSTDFAYGCRMYGNTGTPPRQMIETAIKERISP